MSNKIDILKFLHNERKKNDYFVELHKTNYFIFLSILVIDLLFFIITKDYSITTVAWLGLFTLIVLLGLEIYQIISYNKYTNQIDNFYLENEIKRLK